MSYRNRTQVELQRPDQAHRRQGDMRTVSEQTQSRFGTQTRSLLPVLTFIFYFFLQCPLALQQEQMVREQQPKRILVTEYMGSSR